MKRSNSVFFVVVLTITLTFSVLGQNEPISKLRKSDKSVAKTDAGGSAKKEAVRIETIERDMSEALALVEEHHFSGRDANYNDLFKSIIDSMLHTLDPHSSYLDAADSRNFLNQQNSRYYGIGATIGDMRDKDGKVIATYIKSTFDGAPANRAGLRYGDKILQVNGRSVLGQPYYNVRNFLRGPKGTPAKLLVQRNGSNIKEKVEIIRDAVPFPSIPEYYMVKPKIGYIAMTIGFQRTTYYEFVNAYKELEAAGMESLILDLRENGGGLVNQALGISNAFLANGQAILTQKGRSQPSQTYASENPNPYKIPMIVLVNRQSASASEIIAGALQDHDRALIVGDNSFGKGLVQNPFQLDYGSTLLLTIAKYETPSGRLIQRDYSDGNLYDYKNPGRNLDADGKTVKPLGPPSKTDSGRIVYGGGGITPDFKVEARKIPRARGEYQAKLADPIFSFVLKLAAGQINGFESYKVAKPILFDHDITVDEFVVTDKLYNLFIDHAVEEYGFPKSRISREEEFIRLQIRTELVMAAYGSQTSYQVFNEIDQQLLKAIELFPEAVKLSRLSTAPKTKRAAASSN